jgi:hypothetical protein
VSDGARRDSIWPRAWERAAKLADGGNGNVHESVLAIDFFTDHTTALLNPAGNVGIDGGTGEERLHDRLFVGLDRGVVTGVGRKGKWRHV